MSVAAGVYCLHYELIVKEYGACPIPRLVGETETGNIEWCTCELGIYTLCNLITGKSTAAKAALSLCGQTANGFLMKTKRTSDAVIIKRRCKSTLPLRLDDPKTTEGIGEIVIDLCNGNPMANIKSGIRKPKSVPIICANIAIKDSVR